MKPQILNNIRTVNLVGSAEVEMGNLFGLFDSFSQLARLLVAVLKLESATKANCLYLVCHIIKKKVNIYIAFEDFLYLNLFFGGGQSLQ